MKKIQISGELTRTEKEVWRMLNDLSLYRPPSLRDMANIKKCHHAYIERVRNKLFVKGYLDEYGRPKDFKTWTVVRGNPNL